MRQLLVLYLILFTTSGDISRVPLLCDMPQGWRGVSPELTRDQVGVAARSGQATQAAVQAAEINCPALGQQRVHAIDTT